MLHLPYKRCEIRKLAAEGNYSAAEESVRENKLYRAAFLEEIIEELEREQVTEWHKFNKAKESILLSLCVDQATMRELYKEELEEKMNWVMQQHKLEFESYAREEKRKMSRRPLSLSLQYLQLKENEKTLRTQGLFTEAAKVSEDACLAYQQEKCKFYEIQADIFCQKLKKKRVELRERALLIWENELVKEKFKQRKVLPRLELAKSRLHRLEKQMTLAHHKIVSSVQEHGYLPALTLPTYCNAYRGTLLANKLVDEEYNNMFYDTEKKYAHVNEN